MIIEEKIDNREQEGAYEDEHYLKMIVQQAQHDAHSHSHSLVDQNTT